MLKPLKSRINRLLSKADVSWAKLNQEDVPFYVECLHDTDGNVYDFVFGLNWKGVIHDWRTQKYSKK